MDIRKLVWGVILVLCGLGGSGWGAWHAAVDGHRWLQAHRALRELSSQSPQALQRLQQRAAAQHDLLGELGAGLAQLPGVRELAAAGWHQREHAAARRVLHDLPALLAGLLLLWLGHRLLGNVAPRRTPPPRGG